MRFQTTTLAGVWLVNLDRHMDERGYLMRTWCAEEFGARGLNTVWPQCNETMTARCGSVRGMHWQQHPHGEVKLVRCARGRVYDVVADVRPESPTFGQWEAFELSSTNLRQIYIPVGFAHGFQTLEDDTVLHYQMGEAYQPGLSAGFRWDDPAVGITWPQSVTSLSRRDAGLPSLAEATVTAPS